VVPKARLEVYGEFAREDNSYDFRDVLMEPDHISGYTLGLQRAYPRADKRVLVVRGEILNARITSIQLLRAQTPLYVHTPVDQGLTQRGQVLGAPAGYGGEGTVLGVEELRPDGAWSVLYN